MGSLSSNEIIDLIESKFYRFHVKNVIIYRWKLA